MFLEDYNNNNLGKCFLYIENHNEKHFIPMNFHDYANIALKYTISDVREFENANDIVFVGKDSVQASAFWFLAIEAFVNTLLKYLAYDNSVDFVDFKGKCLNGKITQINKFLDFQQADFSKSFPQYKLFEFEDFRNEIFHDRFLENEKKFEKTFLSSRPNLPNLISEIQSLIIAIEFFNYYRFVIYNIDFMPNICLGPKDSFFFEKLDKIYSEIIEPSIKFSLKKHNLQTNLQLEVQENICPKIYSPKNFIPKPVIKAIPDESVNLNPEKTSEFENLYLNMINKNKVNKHYFVIPNYIK